MEFLCISDQKLKVMLDRADMEHFGVDAKDAGEDDPASRRAFWKVLDEVKRKSGFDVGSDKVLVQLYPAKDGGCELFVTKLGALPASAERAVSRSKNVAMLSVRTAVFRFSEFSSLLAAVRVLAEDPPYLSAAFSEDGGKYALLVEERGGRRSLSALFRAAEFGDRLPDALVPNYRVYIAEHGKPLADARAVERLSAL